MSAALLAVLLAGFIAACGVNTTVTAVDRKPIRISMPDYHYPPALDDSGMSGSVAVGLTVTEDGRAEDVVILSSTPPGVFDEAALAAIRSSKWQPALKNGQAYRYEHHGIVLAFDAEPPRGTSANMPAKCKATLDSCSARPRGCISMGFDQQSNCGFECANTIRQRLQTSGISAGVPHPSTNPLEGKGCIGVRKDLGGSDEGAECIRAVLGEKYAVGDCTADGWPYNVRAY